MWRGARADRIVHDDYFPAWLLLSASFVVLGVAGLLVPPRDPGVPLLIGLLGLAGLALRRRVELVGERVRVRWALAPTPTLPALTLRAIDERARDDFAEVLVENPDFTSRGSFHPVTLVYRDPMRRHGALVERLVVATHADRDLARATARRLAADLGLPVRDVRSQDAPAVRLGM